MTIWGSGQESRQTGKTKSASCLTSLRSDKSHQIEPLSPKYHYIETESVPRIRKKQTNKKKKHSQTYLRVNILSMFNKYKIDIIQMNK